MNLLQETTFVASVVAPALRCCRRGLHCLVAVVAVVAVIALSACWSACWSACCTPPTEAPRADMALLPADRGLRGVKEFQSIAGEQARSLALMAELGKVLQHPRCVNCHPVNGRPLQRDGLPHQPLVVGREDEHSAAGMACTTCHGEHNYLQVPGNPHWQLAPAEMAWEGRSLGQICTQIKDPVRNGGKSPEALLRHVAEDELVAYGWHPPQHLQPAPGNQALFAQLFRAWLDSGAHCPP